MIHLPEIKVVAAIIRNLHNKILITKRPQDIHLGGMWEFPGGKVENGEEPETALIREIKEETNLDISVGDLFWKGITDYSKKRVHLFFYNCRLKQENQTIICHEIDDYKWLNKIELKKYEFPEADRQLIDKLTG